MDSYSIYLHIPFCRHRCSYCDFNTYADLEDLITDYVQALCLEIAVADECLGTKLPVHTVYFGGGTPSLLPAKDIANLLAAADEHFRLVREPEINLEANPGTLSLAHLKDLRKLGVNRLSLGAQSANPAELLILEREHDFPAVIQSVNWARQAGFDQVSLDLIFGLPYQSLESWQRTLTLAVGLNPDHLSVYALTLEHGTPLGHWAGRGLISVPDPDLAAEMYEWAQAFLEQSGYQHYEISNWGRQRPDGGAMVCQHNLQYWRNLSYLGLGAGAHGYAAGFRTANVLAPAAYIRRLLAGPTERPETNLAFPQTPATQTLTPITQPDEIGETLMMGLRLVQEGISEKKFEERFGLTLEERFASQITRFISLGLMERAGPGGDILRLTRRGYLLGNQVFLEFI